LLALSIICRNGEKSLIIEFICLSIHGWFKEKVSTIEGLLWDGAEAPLSIFVSIHQGYLLLVIIITLRNRQYNIPRRKENGSFESFSDII
jgi:hypothetical protein